MAKMRISEPETWDEPVIDPVLDRLYERLRQARARQEAHKALAEKKWWLQVTLQTKIRKREAKTYRKSDALLIDELNRRADIANG